MAAGEYVSVSSQADTVQADLARERKELAEDRHYEQMELTSIYIKRGLEPALAEQVAIQLMNYDALGAHARDELGITATGTARPFQAALTSAATFAAGGLLPLIVILLAPAPNLIMEVATASLFFLALLGVAAAFTGGTGIMKSTVRVTFWGALAMALTAGVGSVFGASV